MKNILVSVVIPTYKRTQLLVDAVQSVILQSFENLEIFIVNDNGPGAFSDFVIENFANHKDPRVKLIDYPSNVNGAYARNQGIRASNGDFICFLDDDDQFMRKNVEKQLEYLRSNLDEFDGVYCKLDRVNKFEYSYLEGDLSIAILKEISLCPTSTLMFKREKLLQIGGFDENLERHQDYDLVLRFCETSKLGFVNEFLVKDGVKDGENILYGKKLEVTKLYFLNKFRFEIDKLPLDDQREIYFIHYFNIFFKSIRPMSIGLILKYFFKSFLISPKLFIYNCFQVVKRHI
ncbi:glycosyltransferase family 2 protein [Chryseobacterium sp. A301]